MKTTLFQCVKNRNADKRFSKKIAAKRPYPYKNFYTNILTTPPLPNPTCGSAAASVANLLKDFYLAKET
jgi:hypothetical protein